jgi:hypothetical protein
MPAGIHNVPFGQYRRRRRTSAESAVTAIVAALVRYH